MLINSAQTMSSIEGRISIEFRMGTLGAVKVPTLLQAENLDSDQTL